jgi:hypothetical protein
MDRRLCSPRRVRSDLRDFGNVMNTKVDEGQS